ncbi:MAG: hypothetical protein WCR46_02435 [Deltaproteobacteria bacterium]
MTDELKDCANYVQGYGWYLKPIYHPDQPECTPSDFLGRNRKDAEDRLYDIAQNDAMNRGGIQEDSAEKPLPEPSNPLPKGKAGSWDRSRLLTPSELKSLKENSIAADKIIETRFREIFNKNKTI